LNSAQNFVVFSCFSSCDKKWKIVCYPVYLICQTFGPSSAHCTNSENSNPQQILYTVPHRLIYTFYILNSRSIPHYNDSVLSVTAWHFQRSQLPVSNHGKPDSVTSQITLVFIFRYSVSQNGHVRMFKCYPAVIIPPTLNTHTSSTYHRPTLYFTKRVALTKHISIASSFFRKFSGRECERRSLGRWLGRNSCPFQSCLVFIIATANKGFKLTAGKFVRVCNNTMMNVTDCVCQDRQTITHMKFTR